MASVQSPASAASPARSQFIPPTTKRTNSLGWAKSDCHTCASNSRPCDRRRPRCDACTTAGMTCGGYTQVLKWDPHAFQRNFRQNTVLPESLSKTSKELPKPSTFTFVQDQRNGAKKGRRTRKVAERRRREDTTSQQADDVDEAKDKIMSPVSTPAISTSTQETASPPEPEEDDDVEEVGEPVSTVARLPLGSERRHSDGDAHIKSVIYHFDPTVFQLPRAIREQLSFFKWQFSPITLTYDVRINPWQQCLTQIHEAPFVLDAVVALAKRHRAHLQGEPESLQVLELKDRALCSFASHLKVNGIPCEMGITISLLLIGLDYAETALSDWSIHLRGAYRILESSGGIKLAEYNTQLRSQIAQLIWYDTTAALLSRKGPVFPRTYSEALMSWQVDTEWSLLSLNGYPDIAFLDMYDIAVAASCTSPLPDGHVTRLEMGLWLARFDSVHQNQDKNITALTDCWRLGMLLYCTRVFHQSEASQTKARMLAEEIMWLIHDLPANSATQKQCLLPLFLAGCEMDSFRFRSIAIDFCKRWKDKTGLWLFQSALDLMQLVWASMDENPVKDVWWGDIIKPSSGKAYLLG
ncbi:hypothetical protein NA57DRAFT_52112 [Rhizodiscina lignyota]|uniref:Zn(2)-C6 fungal-type domain-containing protein n=1 Tax=Rhizodiscina lignyota TaxID=1504668 RepID=A0A9P4IN64_9PEZI|nr:hypothetical protein NA57DRAFT_52112 [Rhizodiscina lignyota]